MISNHRHTFIRTHHFININAFYKLFIIKIIVPFYCFDIFNMETKYIVIKNRIFDQICMQAFSKKRCRCFYYVSFFFSVHFKSWCSCKSKELSFFEVTYNIQMHVSKLASVTFINDKYNFFFLVFLHNICISWIFDCIRHLLNSCYNQMYVFFSHLIH